MDSFEQGIQEEAPLATPTVISAPSPNYWPGRNGHKICAIVDHITAGLMPGCLSWMQDPASKVSAHYLVARTGQVYKLVHELDTAWGCGVVKDPTWPLYIGINPNYICLNIEHEGFPAQAEADGDLTPAQYQASLWLHRSLIGAYGIPVDTLHIIPHSCINSDHADCPGPFPWAQLFADLTPQTTPWMSYAGGGISGRILADGRLWVRATDTCELFGRDVYSWDVDTKTLSVS